MACEMADRSVLNSLLKAIQHDYQEGVKHLREVIFSNEKLRKEFFQDFNQADALLQDLIRVNVPELFC